MTKSLADQAFAWTREDFISAQERTRGEAIVTPLLRSSTGPKSELRLKAESLQPTGSFKIRAGANAVALLDDRALAGGVATASAGNFAQGLAWAARRRRMSVSVHAPDTAAKVKLDALRRLGAEVRTYPFVDWWGIMTSRDAGEAGRTFIHPVCEPAVLLGNGVIGLEIAAEWREVETIVAPVGGGGLICGIALALRSLGLRPRIVACEIETSTPLAAALAAGAPVTVRRDPSFVDGIGSTRVMDEMWPILKDLVDDVVVVSIADARTAVRDLAIGAHVVAEGAGAVAFAAARGLKGRVAAVISGGNIDPATFAEILAAA